MTAPVRGSSAELTIYSKANFGGYTPFEVQSITRPANTTAYTAADVVGGNPSTGQICTFTTASNTGGFIVGAKLATNDNTTGGDFIIRFFKTLPTVVADNSAFSFGTGFEYTTSYMGSVTLTLAAINGSESGGEDTGLRIPYGSDGNIFALIETVSGFTPASASTWSMSLAFENNIHDAFPKVR